MVESEGCEPNIGRGYKGKIVLVNEDVNFPICDIFCSNIKCKFTKISRAVLSSWSLLMIHLKLKNQKISLPSRFALRVALQRHKKVLIVYVQWRTKNLNFKLQAICTVVEQCLITKKFTPNGVENKQSNNSRTKIIAVNIE